MEHFVLPPGRLNRENRIQLRAEAFLRGCP